MKLRLSPDKPHRRLQLASLAAVAVVVAVLVGFSSFGTGGAPAEWPADPSWTEAGSAHPASAEFEQAEVVRVVDGDTIVVACADGSKEKVRLIGIDAPESVASEASRNTEEGRIASAYLHDLLPAETPVLLERDVSDRDQYDRLLRYVWLDEPEGSVDERTVAAQMVNGMLVSNGYARAKSYDPDTAYDEVLRALGKEAAREKRGVSYAWS